MLVNLPRKELHETMILGIVGSEAAKFTPERHLRAIEWIGSLIEKYKPSKVVSGACHLGGIDKWSIGVAKNFGCDTEEFPPKTRNWEGYKARNIQIAEASDRIVCITVATLPPGYKEGGWERYCYHCRTDKHIKSGGCWTVKYARDKLGKSGEIIVV